MVRVGLNYEFTYYKTITMGWGCGSVAEHLTTMCEALGSIPSPAKRGKKTTNSMNETLIHYDYGTT